MWSSFHMWDDEGNLYPAEMIEHIITEYKELFQKSVDMKKQFVDNACTFYIYDIVDEEYDSIYALVDGVDEDSYLELQLDADGSISVPIQGENVWNRNYVTFKRR